MPLSCCSSICIQSSKLLTSTSSSNARKETTYFASQVIRSPVITRQLSDGVDVHVRASASHLTHQHHPCPRLHHTYACVCVCIKPGRFLAKLMTDPRSRFHTFHVYIQAAHRLFWQYRRIFRFRATVCLALERACAAVQRNFEALLIINNGGAGFVLRTSEDYVWHYKFVPVYYVQTTDTFRARLLFKRRWSVLLTPTGQMVYQVLETRRNLIIK